MSAGWSYTNLETYTDWIPQNTTGDNPVLAATTPVIYAPGSPGWLTMGISGLAFAAWMLKHGFPITALESGILTCSSDFWVSLDGPNVQQVLEDDSRMTDGNGNVWIADSQLNFAEGGMLCVADPTGDAWVDTGFKPGIPPPGQWATLQKVFKFGSGYSSIVSAFASWGNGSLGQNWTAPATGPQVPLLALGWTGPAQLVKQLQIGQNAQASPFSQSFRNINASAIGQVAA